MIMVAAISAVPPDPKSSSQNPSGNNRTRPPLLPSERENGVQNQQQQRRPRAREVSSRYMSMSMSPSNSSTSTTTNTTTTTTTSTTSSSASSSVSRRFPSPMVSRSSRNNVTTTPKRSQSVDRRRSVTPKPGQPMGNAGEISAATKLLMTSSRSLSVSFQGEAFSLPISKTKAVNQGGNGNGNARKGTPERRRSTPLRGKVDGGGGGGGDQVENSKPGEQHRWPARTRQFNMLSRSLDGSNAEDKEFNGSSVVARALQDSLLDESGRASFDGILHLDSGNGDVLNRVRGGVDVNSVNESSVPSDLTASDTDSVSSGSTSGAQDMNGGSQSRSGSRGIVASARFWQETNMRLRRLQDPGLGLSSSPTSKFVAPPKLSQSRKFSDGPMSSPRAMSSPIRGAVRAASPSKLTPSAASPMRGLSPSRVRSSIGGSMVGSPWDSPSVLSFAVDVRRGKVGENRIVDAHQLRLLYNRHLQWRFVNARADAALSVQRRIAEKNLWNGWIAITALRDSVRHKRTQVQLLRQKLKLSSILRGQIAYLEEWSHLDEDHSNSLHGATEALKASTLRLPVVGGATADIQGLKEAVGSAIDVMHSMASSTGSLLTKVEEVNSLMVELSNVAAKERVSLERCKQVLSMLAALQIKDCSLRTHKLQHHNRSPIA